MYRNQKSQTVVSTPDSPAVPPSVSVAVQPLAVGIVDAARLVGVPPFSVREAIGNGSLPAKKAGRHYIIRVADLQRWIDDLDAVPPQPCFVKRHEARKAAVA